MGGNDKYKRVVDYRRTPATRKKRVYHTNYNDDSLCWQEIEATKKGWCVSFYSRESGGTTDEKWMIEFSRSYPKEEDLNRGLNGHGLTVAGDLVETIRQDGKCLRLGRMID